MSDAFEFTAFEVTAFETEGGTYAASSYAQMMINLLPPGRVWRLVGSVLEAVLAACAEELANVDARVIDLLNEADPSTTVELLDERERELDLEAAATTEERQARIVARLVARQRYRPSDFQAALAPLLGQAAGDVVVIETSHADAVAIEDVREIFRFYILRDPTVAGTYYLDSAQDLVDAIKPSHTAGYMIETVAALYDDPYSLYNRDLLDGVSSLYDDPVTLYDRDVYGA